MSDELDATLAMHDELIARRGVDVWIGAEPTFTRAESLAPAWVADAEGDDKLARAHALATHLANRLPGAHVSRVAGRQYPGEDHPRFAFGVRWSEGLFTHVQGARVSIASPGSSGAPSTPGGTAEWIASPGSAGAPSTPGGSAEWIASPGSAGASSTPGGSAEWNDDAATPPPTELGTDRWLTVTPDPGVVEVNMAPCSTARAFYTHARDVWAAAAEAGLSPLRYRFNGDVADSGGGGQITIGGSRPETSPFVRYPHVLPALIRYINNHPSLSFWFASECVGSASQGPRPDEGTRERWDELGVACGWLEHIADRGECAPEHLWQTLGPLLVDASGNSHRAEVNVEKLWNPHIPVHGPRHGKLGVIELRAVRMPERPGMLVALAALLRSLVTRLAVADYRAPLVDWHDELHDRFALPAALHRDLRLVLGDLDEHRLGIPAALRPELEAWRPDGITCRLGDATLTLRPALEFWPLVGDVASQEQASVRWVDASSQRWEISIDGAGPDRVAIGGKWAHLRSIGDGVRAIGVRRRVFQPSPGLHPGLPVTDPLVIDWAWRGRSQHIELWAWRPSPGPYDGLPRDAIEALERRQERIQITTRDGEELHAQSFWREARPFTIDLRRDGIA